MKPLIILLLALTCSAMAGKMKVFTVTGSGEHAIFVFDWKEVYSSEILEKWKRGDISYRECLDRRLSLQSSTLDSVTWTINNCWLEYGGRLNNNVKIDSARFWGGNPNADIFYSEPKGFPLWLRLFWSAYCWLH